MEEKLHPNNLDNGESDSYDDEEIPETEHLTERERLQIHAMIEQVVLVTNSPQCEGDMQMAMDMMRLDDFEKAIVINGLRQRFIR
jgi:hypothetical protein